MASKVAIVGAGSVGTSLAYAILVRGIAREVALYDLNRAKVEAEVLDLVHGSQFLGSASIFGGDDIEVVRGADVVLITAGAKQKPEQTRLELARVNAGIVTELAPRLAEVAPDAVQVVITNPCDVLTVIAQRASGLPASQVIASGTVLDTSRLRWLLADLAGSVLPSSVHASIVGEHGDSEFALWSGATIGPVPILDWEFEGRLPFTHEVLDRVTEQVRRAAYQVIAGKGATNYAIGLAGARITEAILHNDRAILPVSSVLSGQWDIDGVALSVPSVVGRRGVEQVLDTPLSKAELAQLRASAGTIRASVESLTE